MLAAGRRYVARCAADDAFARLAAAPPATGSPTGSAAAAAAAPSAAGAAERGAGVRVDVVSDGRDGSGVAVAAGSDTRSEAMSTRIGAAAAMAGASASAATAAASAAVAAADPAATPWRQASAAMRPTSARRQLALSGPSRQHAPPCCRWQDCCASALREALATWRCIGVCGAAGHGRPCAYRRARQLAQPGRPPITRRSICPSTPGGISAQ